MGATGEEAAMGSIKFDKINKIYTGGVHAVTDFTFEAKDGEFIVLVGPSGCGKSTVLRMLAGLELITSGELSIDGEVVNSKPPVDRDIAMVFQDYALYASMSIYDNIGMSLRVRHEKDTEIYDQVMETSRTVDMLPYLNRLPGQLSGGQKQRAALGRAIIRRPKVFLMDEPLSNLDAKLRNTTRVELVKLQRSLGVTTIYVTHDQTEAMSMADRIIIMRDGVIQQAGTPTEVYFDPANMFVAGFIGVPQMNFIPGTYKKGVFTFGENVLTIPKEEAAALSRYEGAGLIMGLRPEMFEVAGGPGENVFKAELEACEYLGNHYILHLRLGDQDLVCQINRNQEQADFGKTVYIKPLMRHFYFFDSTNEELVFHGEAKGV